MTWRAVEMLGELGHVDVGAQGVPSTTRRGVLVLASAHKQANYGME